MYVSLGMKVTKIHKVLRFKQSNWSKEFVDFNTEKRKCTSADSEKSFF